MFIAFKFAMRCQYPIMFYFKEKHYGYCTISGYALPTWRTVQAVPLMTK